jgi:protein SCO1/2
MRKNSLIWLFLPVVFGIPVTFYTVSVLWERQFAKLPVYGKLVNGENTSHTIAAFNLTDQGGNFYTTKEWNDKIVVIDFFFTHCAAVCPKMTKSLIHVQKEFKGKDIQINSISVDPERDDAKQLTWFAKKFSIDTTNWALLTGNKKDIYRLARNEFMIVATDGDGGPEDFIHSEKLVLIDKSKKIRGYYNGTIEDEVNMLIHDIKKLQNEY